MKAVAVGTHIWGSVLLGLLLTSWTAGQEQAEEKKEPEAKPAAAARPQRAQSATPRWIWSPSHTKNEVPVGECFFRKSFKLGKPEVGEVQITADNEFELFVNGQPVGSGKDWRKMQTFEISNFLQQGKNSIAVRVANIDEGSAGLTALVLVKEQGGTFEAHSTNGSWKTSVRRYQGWTTPDFPDREWVNAKSYGELGATLPWGDEVILADRGRRFQIGADFTVERLLRDDEVGSLIAMTFDGQGNILASQEGGYLLKVTDTDNNGTPDTVNVFSNQIKNTQGLLSLGTRVFAVGDGPEGSALYRLRDANRDGVAEEIKAIVPFKGSKGEHGPHAVRLGPDGLLYVVVGNHARAGIQPAAGSPYRNAYEGDLVRPRHEDPRGHAVGLPAPGGTVFRTDTNGSFVELVAGGLRNSYDIAFNADGELFAYDADMEWDAGAPWYRPTRINHISPGAEFGWRSGWAKWPDYYVDSLPATLRIGPGSPTGIECYEHTVFPKEFRGALFGCDWATGRIHCVKLERSGASYNAESHAFLEGRPLNATDIAVGPDGALYFSTGGRGTDGGIYRVRWTGEAPEDFTRSKQGIELALIQPQLEADWARAEIAKIKQQLGSSWDQEVEKVARDKIRKTSERLRALDLMVYFGPRPSEALLLELAQQDVAEIRARAARLMFSVKTPGVQNQLVALLDDTDALVRRIACETLTRQGAQAPAENLAKLLGDKDEYVAFAARRALEQMPLNQWGNVVFHDKRPQAFLRGCVPLLASSGATAPHILKRCQQMVAEYQAGEGATLTPNEFVDLLRVTQLSLALGNLTAEQAPGLGEVLLAKYPSGNRRSDRELVRLLTFLQVPGAAEKFAAQMDKEIASTDKLHIAAHASRLQPGWETNTKLTMLQFYEKARSLESGYSVSAYLENFARDFFTRLTLAERRHILKAGDRWPTSALSILAKLPDNPGADLLAELRALDERIRPLCQKSDTFRRLRVGIVAALGRHGDQESLNYLYQMYHDEPGQRDVVAMSLTQQPGGDSWSYLIDALKTAEGQSARSILTALAQVPQRPQQHDAYRQVILQGLRLGDNGAGEALDLLSSWSGQAAQGSSENWHQRLAAWQQWYDKQFPDAPPAALPSDSGKDKWSYDELLAFLSSRSAQMGDAERGKEAFAKAQCVKCHRMGSHGESIGPELTTVAKRFQRKEILESIVYPSHVISDQYASRLVVAGGKTYSGMLVPRGQDGITLLLPTGEKVELAHEDIDEIKGSGVSAMPTGLLNALSLQQVADLFAFLEQEVDSDIARKATGEQR